MDHSWVETQFHSTLAHIAHTCHSDSLVTLIEPMSVCLFYSMPLSSAFNCTGNITWTKYATKHASQCVPIWLGFGSRYINLLPNTTNFWFVFEKLSGEIDLKTNERTTSIFKEFLHLDQMSENQPYQVPVPCSQFHWDPRRWLLWLRRGIEFIRCFHESRILNLRILFSDDLL